MGVEISTGESKKSGVRRVRVVDDEMLIHWSMAEMQTHAGYEVTEAGNAREALQRVSTEPAPDLVPLIEQAHESRTR